LTANNQQQTNHYSEMSWPGGDSTASSDIGAGDVYGRPFEVASLGTFGRKGALVSQTAEQAELSLRMLSTPFESLPQLPPWAFLGAFTKQWHKERVASTLADMSGKLGRLLTPEEADALATHRSIFCRTQSYVAPAFIASTVYLARRGRKRFRFPFYTPTTISPTHFPTAARPFITGQAAIGTWHALRFGAYGTISYVLASATIGAYADVNYMVNVLKDPKCQAIIELAKQAKQDRGRTNLPQQSGISQQFPHQETAGSYEPAPSQTYPQAYERAGAFQGRPQRQQPQQPQQQQGTPGPQPTPEEDDAFLFDDASPVASSQRQQPQPSSTAPAGRGSAWDKLRQQARQGEDVWNQGGQQNVQSRGQPRTEQYTYSPAEQEKAYAKAQAQKEFDAMLERERRGLGESGSKS
jgi:hypothetical protein